MKRRSFSRVTMEQVTRDVWSSGQRRARLLPRPAIHYRFTASCPQSPWYECPSRPSSARRLANKQCTKWADRYTLTALLSERRCCFPATAMVSFDGKNVRFLGRPDYVVSLSKNPNGRRIPTQTYAAL